MPKPLSSNVLLNKFSTENNKQWKNKLSSPSTKRSLRQS